MWSSAMLGYIDALPGAESERAVDHGDIQRYASDHGLDMRRHIIGPFDVVDPAGIGRGKTIQCARKISAHVGIRIFLDDEGRRRMAHESSSAPSFAFASAMNRATSDVISVNPSPRVSS